MIDTDFSRNIQHIRPFLGFLLVGAIALGFGMMINSAAKQLTQSIHTDVPSGVEGSLSLKNKGKLYYGDIVSYESNVSGVYFGDVNTYITTVCFQGDEMVFQKSVLQGVKVYLHNHAGSGLDWDEKEASCSATLMYREVSKNNKVDIYIIDSTSFDVFGRGH